MHIQQVFFSVEKAEKLVSVIRVKRCVVQKDTQKMENTYYLVVVAKIRVKTVDSTPLTSKGVLKRNIYRPFPNRNVLVQ